jgi:hypothetical protein
MLDSKINLIGFIQKGYLHIDLADDEFNELCRGIENEFSIKSTSHLEEGVIYRLSAGVNSMQWVDGAEISIEVRDRKIRIRYAISTWVNSVFFLLIATTWSVYYIIDHYTTVEDISADAFIPFFITIPALMITSLLAMVIFRFRITRTVKRVISQQVIIPKEQQGWMNDTGRCPGCGHRVNAEVTCPECGLALAEK